MISENSKYNFKRLAGIISEGLTLVPDPSGRSDKGTLSYYVEEYMLNITSVIISQLDQNLTSEGYKVAISQGNTKMQENVLATKLIISSNGRASNSKEYVLTTLVNFEQGGNTAVSVSHNSLTEQFNLNSKHTWSDVQLFVKEIITHISNSLKVN